MRYYCNTPFPQLMAFGQNILIGNQNVDPFHICEFLSAWQYVRNNPGYEGFIVPNHNGILIWDYISYF